MYVNEFYTSQSCPRCQCQTFTVGDRCKFRVKYCLDCNIYYHRDTMAGQNMIRIALSELNGKGRPIDLKSIYINSY